MSRFRIDWAACPCASTASRHDLSERERGDYSSWGTRQGRQPFATWEDLAYRVVQERRFRNNEQPTRIMARVRFVGHYKDATREPKRIVAKTVEDTRFWDWYYRNRLQMNPYTELVWDVEVPTGVSEWHFRFERRSAP